MSSASISVDISDTLNDMERIIDGFESRINRFLTMLSDIAVQSARGVYGNSVTVSATIYDNGFVINADGSGVCFIEFGAGTKAGQGAPISNYESIPFSVRPGSYSEQNAQQFSNNGYWLFGGRKYEYVTPRPGMHTASERVKQNIIRIAEEVFDD